MRFAAGIGVLAAVLFLGWQNGMNRMQILQAEMSSNLLRQVTYLARSINPALVKQLAFAPEDVAKPAYHQIQRQLAHEVASNPALKWAYAIARKGEGFVFGPDNLRQGDQGYEPPGLVYQNPPPELAAIFTSKHPVLNGPYTDEWGTFYSAYAPVYDPHTGEVLMLVGLDIDTDVWSTRLAAARRLPTLVALGLLLMLSVTGWLIHLANRHRQTNPMNLRAWIVYPLALMVLIGMSGYGYYQYRENQRRFHAEALRMADQIGFAVEQEFQLHALVLQALTERIANHPMILQAWRSSDAGALRDLMQPVYDQARNEYGLTHLYGIWPDLSVAVRMHKPEDAGDVIDRFTLRLAAETGVHASGLDAGVKGTIALRYVRVCHFEDLRMGYIEAGIDLEQILKRIESVWHARLIPLMDKSVINKSSLEARHASGLRHSPWEAYDAFVALGTDQDAIPAEIETRLDALYSEIRQASVDVVALDDGRRMLFGLMPLRDASGRKLGKLLILHDSSDELPPLMSAWYLSLGMAILLASGVAVILLWITGLLETRLQAAFAKIKGSDARYQELYTMLRMLCDNASDMIWAKDLQKRFIFTNKAVCQRLLSAENTHEPLGKTDLFFAERERARQPDRPDWHTFGEICRDTDAITMAAGEPRQFDESGNVQGKFLFLDVRKAPLYDDNGIMIGTVGTARDVTAEKAAEETLRNERQYFKHLFEHAPAATWLNDFTEVMAWMAQLRKEGVTDFAAYTQDHPETIREALGMVKVRDLNPAAVAQNKAKSREELMDNLHKVIDQERLTSFHQQLIAFWNGEQTFEGYFFGHALDGSRQHILVRVDVPSVDGRPDFSRVVVSGLDVTELTLAQEEVAKKDAQLLQAQKMEAIGRLAGGIAHDFNNMLGVILGYTELATEQAPAGSSLHKDLREVYDAAKRSAALTRQLLAFARREKVAPRCLQLNEAIVGLLNMLKRLIGEHITVNWEPGEALWPVWVDPSQLDQVLANLAVNARDAIRGTGTLTIATANVSSDAPEITANTKLTRQDYVRLSVTDTGCGMPPEVLAHLFEPFFTTKDVGIGTGLGLSTVYGILEQSGGTITVKSEPGRGTTFRMYWPKALDEVRDTSKAGVENQAPSAPVRPAGNLGTILVVEDEAMLLRFTSRVLKQNGYTVWTAANPEEALAMMHKLSEPLDLLLTDILMPGMNGITLAAEVARLLQHPIKILLVSGYSKDMLKTDEPLPEGAEFLAKPFSADDLLAKVSALLGGPGS